VRNKCSFALNDCEQNVVRVRQRKQWAECCYQRRVNLCI